MNAALNTRSCAHPKRLWSRVMGEFGRTFSPLGYYSKTMSGLWKKNGCLRSIFLKMLHCLRSNVTVNAIRYFCIFDSNPFKEPDLVSSSRDFGLLAVSKIENRQQSTLKIERQNPRLNKNNISIFCRQFLHTT